MGNEQEIAYNVSRNTSETKEILTLALLDVVQSLTQKKSVKGWHLICVGHLCFLEK